MATPGSYRRRRFRRWNATQERNRSTPVYVSEEDRYVFELGWVVYNGTVVPYEVRGRGMLDFADGLQQKFVLVLEPVVHSMSGTYYGFHYYVGDDFHARQLIAEHCACYVGRSPAVVVADISDIHCFLKTCYDAIFTQVVSTLKGAPGQAICLNPSLVFSSPAVFCNWCAVNYGEGYFCKCGRLPPRELPPPPPPSAPENGVYYGNLAEYYVPPSPDSPMLMPPINSVYNSERNPYYQDFPSNYYQSPPALCSKSALPYNGV